jgi:bla regulator protein BlaR1
MALGQSSGGPVIAAATVAARAASFDVVSIKPSAPDEHWHYGMSPTGYSQHAVVLRVAIGTAYLSSKDFRPNAIQGAPPWVTKDLYDIDAKVAEADAVDWRKQTPAHRELLQAMLQAALADRCKLVVHRVPAEMDGFALVVAKDQPKFKRAPADEELPTGPPLADGGVMVFTGVSRQRIEWTYHGATMASLANMLSGAGVGVVDQTGLTGKYDFVLKRIDMSAEQDGRVSMDAIPDPASLWDLGALGLKVVPIKIPVETIVIDHIEKPSEN